MRTVTVAATVLNVVAVVLVVSDPTRSVAAADSPYSYRTEWFTSQRRDHFHFASATADAVWSQRYLINDQWFDASAEERPLFFYAGNEGPIEVFADNTGFMWDAAAQFGALIVFAEHRYYGQSFPSPYDPTNSTIAD